METTILFVLGLVVFGFGLHVLKLIDMNFFRVAFGLLLIRAGADLGNPGFDAIIKLITNI